MLDGASRIGSLRRWYVNTELGLTSTKRKRAMWLSGRRCSKQREHWGSEDREMWWWVRDSGSVRGEAKLPVRQIHLLNSSREAPPAWLCSFACDAEQKQTTSKGLWEGSRGTECQTIFFSADNNFMDHSFELIGRMEGSDANHVSPGWYLSENLNNFYFLKGQEGWWATTANRQTGGCSKSNPHFTKWCWKRSAPSHFTLLTSNINVSGTIISLSLDRTHNHYHSTAVG